MNSDGVLPLLKMFFLRTHCINCGDASWSTNYVAVKWAAVWIGPCQRVRQQHGRMPLLVRNEELHSNH